MGLEQVRGPDVLKKKAQGGGQGGKAAVRGVLSTAKVKRETGPKTRYAGVDRINIMSTGC